MNVGFCSQECFDHFHQCFKIKNKQKTREYIQNNIYFWPEGSIRAKTISLKHFKSIPEEFFTEYPKLKRFLKNKKRKLSGKHEKKKKKRKKQKIKSNSTIVKDGSLSPSIHVRKKRKVDGTSVSPFISKIIMSPTKFQVIKSQLLATQDSVSKLENDIPPRIEMGTLVDHEVDVEVDSEEEKSEINYPISQENYDNSSSVSNIDTSDV